MDTRHDQDAQQGPGYKRKPHKFAFADWKEAFGYVRRSIDRDHLSVVAPGVAFYLMFALIPGLVALISMYGLIADPADVQEHFAGMEGAMPEEAHGLLMDQMDDIAAEQGAAGLGAIIGIVLALWAASRATLALMEGLNITYDTEETRGMIKMAATRLALTAGAVMLGVLAMGVIVVLPPLLNALPLPDAAITALSLVRWPLLLGIGVLGLALLYRFAPDRSQPKFRWLSWGSAIAAILWVVASVLFSIYVENFGAYDDTYGAFGAIIILLTWLLLTAYVILLGAEIDVALERQTKRAEPLSQ